MQILHKVTGNTLFVCLIGELDEHSSEYTRMKLDNIFENNNFNKIIIDFKELDFMDSTGIGILIGRYKKMKNKQIPIYITNPSSQTERIFQMSGLYKIMPKIS